MGESESNGMVERAIQSVQGQIKTIKDIIETEAKMTISPESHIWPWMIEYAGYTLLSSKMDSDGKTAMQRYRGKRSMEPIV